MPPVELVIARHPGLVDFLREKNVLADNVEVISHVEDPSVLDDRHVAGVLPLNLAARCASVLIVALDMPPALRGKELSAEEMKALNPRLEKYEVHKIWAAFGPA